MGPQSWLGLIFLTTAWIISLTQVEGVRVLLQARATGAGPWRRLANILPPISQPVLPKVNFSLPPISLPQPSHSPSLPQAQPPHPSLMPKTFPPTSLPTWPNFALPPLPSFPWTNPSPPPPSFPWTKNPLPTIPLFPWNSPSPPPPSSPSFPWLTPSPPQNNPTFPWLTPSPSLPPPPPQNDPTFPWLTPSPPYPPPPPQNDPTFPWLSPTPCPPPPPTPNAETFPWENPTNPLPTIPLLPWESPSPPPLNIPSFPWSTSPPPPPLLNFPWLTTPPLASPPPPLFPWLTPSPPPTWVSSPLPPFGLPPGSPFFPTGIQFMFSNFTQSWLPEAGVKVTWESAISVELSLQLLVEALMKPITLVISAFQGAQSAPTSWDWKNGLADNKVNSDVGALCTTSGNNGFPVKGIVVAQTPIDNTISTAVTWFTVLFSGWSKDTPPKASLDRTPGSFGGFVTNSTVPNLKTFCSHPESLNRIAAKQGQFVSN